MSEVNKAELAKKVYDSLCQMLDNREWHYEKDEDKLVVTFRVSGDDIPMMFVMHIDADRQLIRLYSPLPFKFSEDKRMEGAIATCVASYGMVDGCFDYDISDGNVSFRMTTSYRESKLGEGMFRYMVDCSCAMVDLYNDKFLAINKGLMDIATFIASR